MRWGEPVIGSSITQISAHGPSYRNRSAVELAAAGASFESVAQLLMTGVWQDSIAMWPNVEIPKDVLPLLDAYAKISSANGIATSRGNDMGNVLGMVSFALGMRGRGAAEIADGNSVQAARLMIQSMAGCVGFLGPPRRFVNREPGESVAAYIMRAAGGVASPSAMHAMNGALIVLADNELAPATFAARVAASTNADLFNCVSAAIGSHVGFSTGTATQKVETLLLKSTKVRDLEERLSLVREYGASLFGFNHPLYPGGDARADLILKLVGELPAVKPGTRNTLNFLAQVRETQGAHAGVAIALVALAKALGLPDGTATAIWIISRTAGWVAHALEQRTQAFLLRPRAKYIATPRPF